MNIGIGMYPSAYNPAAAYSLGNSSNVNAVGKTEGAPINGKNALGEPVKADGTVCQTCKERTYQDGSDENVSFKSAAHISPNAAGTAVRAHEQEHVVNAYEKAAEKNGRVLNASVSIKTAICPECGRSYVAGGLTRTTIKYSNEKNPYQENLKKAHKALLTGMNFEAGA